MPDKKIFIVDDEEDFVYMTRQYLEGTGKYRVFFETDSTKALAGIRKKKPDVVLLDIMMPGLSGDEICRQLRSDKATSAIPVIMLSAKSDVSDKVALLVIGADDYLGKQFSLEELNARISAVLRRSYPYGEDRRVSVGDLVEIDPACHDVKVSGAKVDLTPAEFQILTLLASNRGRVFSRAEILEHLWGGDKGVTERTIDVHITHLREKLGEAGKFVVNIRSAGYKLDEG